MAKIKKAEYVLSAAWKSQWPSEDFPEMCLAGRSNVGKSSFINTMLNRKALAKVSGTPGKTKTLNFFNVNDALYFVDVPGYGYAKVNNNVTKQFGKTMDEYITHRSTLKGFILLVDYRHKPTKDDVMMYEFVKHYDVPVIVVATKEDKLKRNDLKKNEKIIKDTLNFDPQDQFIRFSSLKKKGINEAWQAIYKLCDINFDEVI
ncbi:MULTISPECIES: ribosome biogenesis GTP-binding protein YihA/YsxC [Coprobacillaceae]|uniref:ribosome biogenesis GTP-binding protein YihA/YsxC n=1 Tax=Coprobacillaceae TaxID=2810280 RepID=UPI000E50BDD9|nr:MULTISPECIES: ribosome biogenesis GTP-binding protein YihA/YsxC [Coprobacillaceae]RHM62415.1 YihA family ribosome biogenesis GTP-binding protein [Coprobacillus sp. AF33-1AC]RHS95644.1 YihA family ribosome biogenesis GTP-binding protein [Erysipelatoclostridium sp. AM42-17]